MIINIAALEYMHIHSHLSSFSNCPTLIRFTRALYTFSDSNIKTSPIGKTKNKQGHKITVLI